MIRTLIIIPLLFATPVWAETIIRCGEISGTAYYLPSGKMAGEWVEDKAGGSSFTLVQNGGEDTDFDILFGDGAGVNSVKSQGGQLFLRRYEHPAVTFFAEYKDLYEIWSFNLGKKEMLLSQHRFGGLVPKVSLYKAQCF
ncbi:hypothetical protein N9P30_02310 [Alphaproteobacteria bacterium]|nr:hypothetical protein [Alphaproteobacteria bacterium]